MAVNKTFGKIHLEFDKPYGWVISELLPHVCIKLKGVFAQIAESSAVPFWFVNSPQMCHDLLWFMDRYPLMISKKDHSVLTKGRREYLASVRRVEDILTPNYHPSPFLLNDGQQARPYQLQTAEFHKLQKRFLLGDDLGLGKTLSGILACLNPDSRPAVVVVQTHLPNQWKIDGIEKFTGLSTHIIKQTKLYDLPPADIYILKYSYLAKWVDFFPQRYFKSVIFDEAQELRRSVSDKYKAAKTLSDSVNYCMGMTATPVYNFGDEIFNIMNLIKPGCLGKYYQFLGEWCSPHGKHWKVNDPAALGTYLRESHLFLRRTRSDVGRELPPINKILCDVGYDEQAAEESHELAMMLSIKVTTGSFIERGVAARELDILMRQATGVAKARRVAGYVRILLENKQPVVLAGWHREVYEIWMEELKDFSPVMYTGSESLRQKEEAKAKFVAGETDLFIISLRSGIGLDGLQHRCKDVVIGELDWSPKVHDQIIGRVDRDQQEHQVSAYFLVCDWGSDPVIINLLGLKSSQSAGIIDPLEDIPSQHSDESRIKILAETYLNRHKHEETVLSQG